jgi:HK97 family phage major capsid protein
VNLKEIAERRAAIQAEVETPDLPIERLEELKTEVEKLNDEERALLVEAEKREELIKATLAGKGEVITKIEETRKETQKPMEYRELIAKPEYRTAWLKSHLGFNLSEDENKAIAEVRSVAQTNASAVIPVETSNKIFALLKQKAPLLNEVTLYRVNGAVNVPVAATNNDAVLHTENGLISGAADTWNNVQLSAFEIVKLVRISKSLMGMAIDAFENHLVEAISDKLAQKIEAYLIYGTGDAQPKGINASRVWSDASNGVDWAGAAPTAAELMEQASYIAGGHFANAKWLLNHKTLFQFVYPLRDDSKYPILREGADGYYIFGKKVLLSDYVADGDIFFGDFKAVVANLSEDIMVERSDASGFAYAAVDFRGYCTFDSDIAIAEAFTKSEATLA